MPDDCPTCEGEGEITVPCPDCPIEQSPVVLAEIRAFYPGLAALMEATSDAGAAT